MKMEYVPSEWYMDTYGMWRCGHVSYEIDYDEYEIGNSYVSKRYAICNTCGATGDMIPIVGTITEYETIIWRED